MILDFYHAAEYLFDLAKQLHPRDEDKAQELGEQWCHTMKHEGGAAILKVLEHLEVPPRSRELREKLTDTIGYVKKNLHRMDYPTYRQNGWLIGSGSIESACKTVVGQRSNWLACVGAWMAPTPCVTCVPCSKVNAASGMPSGNAMSTCGAKISDFGAVVYRRSTNSNDAHPSPVVP